MAEEKPTQQTETPPAGANAPAAGNKMKPLIWILLTFGVIVVFGLAGFLLGGKFRKGPAEASAKPPTEEAAAPEPAHGAAGAPGGECEYVDLEPFTVTLDTPRRDRFLAVTVILAIHTADQKAVAKVLEKNKREVRSKLTLYLNSRSLEDVTGTKNLNRVLREMQDLVNELLWPGQRPMVAQVLVKNLAIQ
jgi:flagellar basal body-associated protein FliL